MELHAHSYRPIGGRATCMQKKLPSGAVEFRASSTMHFPGVTSASGQIKLHVLHSEVMFTVLKHAFQW